MKLLGFRSIMRIQSYPVAPKNSLPLATCSWLSLLPPHHYLNDAYWILRCDLTRPTYTVYIWSFDLFPWFKIIKSHGTKTRKFHPPLERQCQNNPCHLMWLYTPRYLRSTQVAGPSSTNHDMIFFFRIRTPPLKITWPMWFQAVTFFGMVGFLGTLSWPESWPNSTFGDVQRSRILTLLVWNSSLNLRSSKKVRIRSKTYTTVSNRFEEPGSFHPWKKESNEKMWN